MKRLALIAILLGVGCVTESPDTSNDHVHEDSVFVKQALNKQFNAHDPFQQVGVMYDANEPLQYRIADGQWKNVNVTWREAEKRVGIVKLTAPTTDIEFRSSKEFNNATFQFYPEVLAPEQDFTRSETRVARQTLAPADLVVSRSDWGSRNPDKVCGSAHSPSMMSIHHTALPADDGGDAAARMRQIQAYHIDSNGWCDIGYHFVVAQSGVIYQGRSSERRTGAHVGNMNTNNVGICMIGNFQEQTPSDTQLESTAKIMSWVGDTYDIPFNRNVIKGHGEWPGQSTSCPGSNTLAALDQLIADAEQLTNGPLEPCAALGEEGGEVDDKSPCFQKFGPADFWRTETGGVGDRLFWTNAFQTDEPSNWARWNVNVTTPGKYLVEYNAVSEFAVYNSARYGVAHDGTEENVTVDLSVGDDGWNAIGEFEFAAGEEQWVAVYDDSPLEVAEEQHIIADAIRLTLVTDEDPGVDPGEDGDDVNNTQNDGDGDGEDVDPGSPPGNDDGDDDGDLFAEANADDIRTNDGCSTTGGSAPVSLMLLCIGFFAFRIRRRE